MRHLLVFFFFAIMLPVHGQPTWSSVRDSLVDQYEKFEGGERHRLELLRSIIWQTLDYDTTTAFLYHRKLDSLGITSVDSSIIMEVKFVSGVVLKKQSKNKEAEKLLLAYSQFCDSRGITENVDKTHHHLGSLYNNMGQFEKAIYHCTRARDYVPLSNYKMHFNITLRITQAQRKTGLAEMALKEWKWYTDNVPTKDPIILTRVYAVLSDLYADLGKLDSVILYADKSEQIAIKDSLPFFEHKAIVNKADAFLKKGDIKKATTLGEKGLAFFQNNKNSFLAYVKIRKVMGKIAMRNHNWRKAQECYEEGNYVAKSQFMLLDEIDFTKELIQLELAHGDPNQASVLLDTLDVLTARQNDSSSEQAILRIQKQYDVEKKELQIGKLNAENQLQIANRKKAQKNTWFALLGVLALGLISFLLYRSLTIKKKSSKLLQEKNEIISAALAEKELLLIEIHHRVKNNLQVVSSLLALQSQYIKDDNALNAINEGRNRVRSMALIHQNLYSKDNLTGINVKSYLETLIKGLFDTYNIDKDKIQLKLNIQDLDLDVDTVVPLGLIANELVTNALKHAFTNQDKGEIEVSLKIKESVLLFNVRDNGKGMDTSMLNEEMESFGYQMILAFKEKLDANLILDGKKGMNVKLEIKNFK